MRRAWQRLLALIHRDRIDRELQEDVQAHLELAERDARAAGLSPEDARRDALRRFGPVEAMKEAHRDERGVPWLENLVRDVRYGLRATRRNPGFAAVAVCTLALGIGANTAIFSVVNAVLLRPLPYREADRLVTIASNTDPGMRRQAYTALSYPDYQDIKTLTGAIADAAAYSNDRYNLINVGEPREVQVTRATPNLLSVLGVSPVIGRDFGAGEAHASVAIVSRALWLSEFGGDTRALGRPISLDDKHFTIIGVMPANVPFPDASTDVWIPIWWGLADAPAMGEMRAYRAFSTVARLAPGASLDRLVTISICSASASPPRGRPPRSSEPARASPRPCCAIRSRATRGRRFYSVGAVALVLLIACVNAANLLMARANSRARSSRCAAPSAGALGDRAAAARRSSCSRSPPPSPVSCSPPWGSICSPRSSRTGTSSASTGVCSVLPSSSPRRRDLALASFRRSVHRGLRWSKRSVTAQVERPAARIAGARNLLIVRWISALPPCWSGSLSLPRRHWGDEPSTPGSIRRGSSPPVLVSARALLHGESEACLLRRTRAAAANAAGHQRHHVRRPDTSREGAAWWERILSGYGRTIRIVSDR